jgi:hypothetical protein
VRRYQTVDTEYISTELTTFITNPAFCFAALGVVVGAGPADYGHSSNFRHLYNVLTSAQRLELNRVHRGISYGTQRCQKVGVAAGVPAPRPP